MISIHSTSEEEKGKSSSFFKQHQKNLSSSQQQLPVLNEEKNLNTSEFDMNNKDINFPSKLPAITELINLKQKYLYYILHNLFKKY